jgi:glc operon protein GlcG
MTNPTSMTTPGGNLSRAACNEAIEAAVKKAGTLGVAVSVAVLDAGGHLLGFTRMNDIHAGTVDVSIAKARCAAMFKRPTKVFADAYAQGATAVTALPHVVPFDGGVPIIAEGKLLGAVGCSGASPEQDGVIAAEAAAAIQSLAEKKHV